MKKGYVIPVVFIMILMGCDGSNLFYGNLYESVDIPPIPADLSNESVSTLLDLAASWGDHFYDSIDTRSEYEDVTDTLADYIASSSNTDQVQEAAIVLATLNLSYFGADESLNQATQNVSLLEGMDLTDPLVLSAYMFGSGTSSSEIARQLLGMYDAFYALEAYGLTLDSSDPPLGADTNLLAMQALTAAMMTALVNDVITDTGCTRAEAVVSVGEYLAGDTGVQPWNVSLAFLSFNSSTTDAAMESSLSTGFTSPGIANTIMGGIAVSSLLRQ